MLYVGSIHDDLETRLRWPKSKVYKSKKNKPKILLIVNAPCKDRKLIHHKIQ